MENSIGYEIGKRKMDSMPTAMQSLSPPVASTWERKR